jgi:hypothetical protein
MTTAPIRRVVPLGKELELDRRACREKEAVVDLVLDAVALPAKEIPTQVADPWTKGVGFLRTLVWRLPARCPALSAALRSSTK